MRPVPFRRTLATLAVAALGLGVAASPANADPLLPETKEQAKVLGDASAKADVTSPDESTGSLAPGNIPFLPMDFSYTP